MAETLAEAGLSVLLLERGSGVLPPETANKRDTWDAVRCCSTTGTTILPTVLAITGSHSLLPWQLQLRSECSETIRGQDGIAMFTGNCIGGATSFNLGMYIEEQPSWIVQNFGAGFGTEDEVDKAYKWVSHLGGPVTFRVLICGTNGCDCDVAC